MFALIENGVGLTWREEEKVIAPILRKFRAEWGERLKDIKKQYDEACYVQIAAHPKSHFDDKVAIVNSSPAFGGQPCPFNDDFVGEGDDIIIHNINTGKQLVINPCTAHLAKVHHLLEKGNIYGISARDFYKYFMPDRYDFNQHLPQDRDVVMDKVMRVLENI